MLGGNPGLPPVCRAVRARRLGRRSTHRAGAGAHHRQASCSCLDTGSCGPSATEGAAALPRSPSMAAGDTLVVASTPHYITSFPATMHICHAPSNHLLVYWDVHWLFGNSCYTHTISQIHSRYEGSTLSKIHSLPSGGLRSGGRERDQHLILQQESKCQEVEMRVCEQKPDRNEGICLIN